MPTEISKTSSRMSLIDLIIVKDLKRVHEFGQTIYSGISDHDIIFCSYNVHEAKPENEYISKRNYASLHYDQISLFRML